MNLIKLATYFGKERKSHIGDGAAIGSSILGLAFGSKAIHESKSLNKLVKSNIVKDGLKYGSRGLIVGGLAGAGIGALIRTKKKDKK
jgi:hypothetical protein